MADRDETRAGEREQGGSVPRSDHVAEPNERLTPEQREVREALASEQGRIPGGPPSAQGGTQGYPEERRVAPTTTGRGSDDPSQLGSDAAGGSVIDTRRPERKQAAERENDPERIADRMREER